MTGSVPESVRELAAGYALGALTAEEARAFEAAMAGSPELVREVAEYREVNALLALGRAADRAPSPEVRARLVERIGDRKVGRLPAPPRRFPAPLVIGLAATTVIAIGLGLRVRALSQELAGRDRSLVARDSALAAVTDQLARRERTLNTLLTGEDSLTVVFLTTAGAGSPGIQLYWNRRENVGVVHAFRLPPAAAGKVYQLWLIRDGTPIPSTTFTSEADGHALVGDIAFPPGGRFDAAAITVEPAGGSSTPTMPILLVGRFAGP